MALWTSGPGWSALQNPLTGIKAIGPLEQNILDLSQRQQIADIHHHNEADHLGRAVEITEGIAHRRRLRILARRLKPIYSDNAVLELRNVSAREENGQACRVALALNGTVKID